MINMLIDKVFVIVTWLSSRVNRLRLQGARIEVMAFVVSRNPTCSVLLVQVPYGNIYMPPQEGVCIRESFQDAFFRCVQDECGINVPLEPNARRRLFYLRHIEYLGVTALPRDRWGERHVADDAADTPLGHVQLKKKAYWAQIAVVKTTSDIEPKPDGREIVNAGWFEFEKARELVQSTNRPEKAALVLKGLALCERHLCGKLPT